MNKKKRQALEASGWIFGDAEDFLELSRAERELVKLRLAVSRAIRARRLMKGLTQSQAARLLGTSQPRVAQIEAGAGDVTLDLMFRGLYILGGSIKDVRTVPVSKTRPPRPAARGTGSTVTAKKAKSASGLVEKHANPTLALAAHETDTGPTMVAKRVKTKSH
jgi:transcriptional regulator with XRE-family HTH domain